MQYVVNAEEMKRYDHNTITKIGIPSLVLMERAALETVAEILNSKSEAKKVLVVAGSGNNGGDGFAIGRMLAQKGLQVTFLFAGDKDKVTPETDEQIKILYNLGFSIQSKFQKAEYDIVVDAIFGIGLRRKIESNYRNLIEEINVLGAEGAFICSVDIPSGISADNGKIMGCAVKADLTVSYAFSKRGHLLYPGKEYTGKLAVKDIGIPEEAFFEKEPSAFCYTLEDIKDLLPQRKADGNKGTFGKVLLMAGSHDMCGACIVCGSSILRTGAGMVKIISQESNREIIQSTLPEAMLYSYDKLPDMSEVYKAMEWADVVVVGPGLGKKSDACLLVRGCLENTTLPMVIDADALNLIGEQGELKELLKRRDVSKTILTPHPGELVRLLEKDISVYKGERMEMIEAFLKEYDCILVAKDAATLVVGRECTGMYLNTSGNDGMATAGTGDALAGIIGGLLSQRTEGFMAATLGVYLHGLAGEAATSKNGHFGMIATDLVKELTAVMKR